MDMEVIKIQDPQTIDAIQLHSDNQRIREIQEQSQTQSIQIQSFPIMLLYPFIDILLFAFLLKIANETDFQNAFLNIETYYGYSYNSEEPKPLLIASLIIAGVSYALLSILIKINLKKVIWILFLVFQALFNVGLCVIANSLFCERRTEWNTCKWSTWTCIIIVFITYGCLNIGKAQKVKNQYLALMCLLLPQLVRFCIKLEFLQIESVGIASLYSLNALYWTDGQDTQNLPWINSLPISGILFSNIKLSINIFMVQPIQTVLRFTYRNQSKVHDSSKEQKRLHLIKTYCIMIIVLGMSILFMYLIASSQLYKIYLSRSSSQAKSLTEACYVIIPLSHFTGMLIYLVKAQTQLTYVSSQLLFRLEIIFFPLLCSSLIVTETIERETDGYCLLYSLFFTALGIIGLLGYCIGNLEHNEYDQLKYIFILVSYALICVVYQIVETISYMSISIGLIVGLSFTFYAHYYSNFILRDEVKLKIYKQICQIYIEDTLVTAAACLNPFQIINYFIQYLYIKQSQKSK